MRLRLPWRKLPDPEIKAAGGVIVREKDDALQVVVIHRPKYVDWSLPKGKLEAGEGWEKAALREVYEETGFRCEIGDELPEVAYFDRKGRSKLVRYWRMTRKKGKFSENAEVDELRWVDLETAEELLHYEHDLELVRKTLG
jgi:8-oxo-dGTP diphosphatase